MAGIRGLSGGSSSTDGVRLPEMPKLPKEVTERFKSMVQWQLDMDEWMKKVALAIKRGG